MIIIQDFPAWYDEFATLVPYGENAGALLETMLYAWLLNYTPERANGWTVEMWALANEIVEDAMTHGADMREVHRLELAFGKAAEWASDHAELINRYMLTITFNIDPDHWQHPEVCQSSRSVVLHYIPRE